MDEFKKKMKWRQIMLGLASVTALSAIFLTSRLIESPVRTDNIDSFIDGFQVGFTLMFFLIVMFFMQRNLAALKNPDKMKKLFISETDERKLFILQKSGSDGMNVIIYGLSVGTAVAGNINDTVFFTLLVALFFVISVRGFLKLYYRVKY
ncbi:MAG: hypothetical protein FWD90_00805 [Defluviitaleaceae bacterium]|nr:hypothetical protein [Defluviitaleaceae bacterium]